MIQTLEELLVVCDLELLLDAGGRIPQVTRDVLRLFNSRGGKLTVFSQSAPEMVKGMLAEVPLAAPAVLCGGSLLYDFYSQKSTTVGEDGVFSQRALQRLPFVSGVGIAVQMTDGATYVLRSSKALQKRFAESAHPYVLRRMDDLNCADILRVFVYQDNRMIPEVLSLEKLLEKSMAEGHSPLRGERINAETMILSPMAATGEEALRRLGHLCKVPQERLAVITKCSAGRELVRYAGMSAASADAPADIQVMADLTTITKSHEGALAEYLYHLIRLYA